MEHFCANILKSGHWPRTRCRLKIFYFLALVVILFNGAEPLWPSWIFDRHNFSLFQSRSRPVAKEQVSAQSDLRFEKRCRKLIFKMAAVVAILDFLSAHLTILCQLDYRGDVQNLNSQHKCIGPIQMHGETNLTLP